MDPGEMEEGNAEIEGQAKTQKKSRASGWERGDVDNELGLSVCLRLYVSLSLSSCVCLPCLPVDSRLGRRLGRD